MSLWNGNYYDEDDNRRWLSSATNNEHRPLPLYHPPYPYDRRDDSPSYPALQHQHHPYSLHDTQHQQHPYLPQLQHDTPQYHAYMTTTIGRTDVLSGRGGATNSHSGNKAFRRLVKAHQDEYLKAKKKDKPAVAARVVEHVRKQGGHFLRQHSSDGRHIYWVDIGDERAKEKTCQALREGAPAIRRKKNSKDTAATYFSDEEEEEEELTGIQQDDKEMEERDKPLISATNTSSWESSLSSIDDTMIRPWKRLMLHGDGQPLSVRELSPMERDLYLREFLPPMPVAHKKTRLVHY